MLRSLLLLIAVFLFTASLSAQKANYKSKEMKNVSFDVYRNWELLHEKRAEMVRLPGKGDNWFEVGEQTLDRPVPEFLKLVKKEMPDIKKTTFNGYEAYGATAPVPVYVIFKGKSVYFISSMIQSTDKNIAEQLKTMLASIRFD